MEHSSCLRIGIIGGGFSGTVVASMLHRYTKIPIEIILLDKSSRFGAGDAYSTPFPFHLLNVRAKDMSAYDDLPTHFVDWLLKEEKNSVYLDKQQAVAEQFVPRLLYHHYLHDILETIQSDQSSPVKLSCQLGEAVDVVPHEYQMKIKLKEGGDITVDKVILATGNNQPPTFPFMVAEDMPCIKSPWDYQAPAQIETHEPVLIVGTGLSMIDTVLMLHHQQHQGDIYAVSRHGFLPLPHTDSFSPYQFTQELSSPNLRALIRQIRRHSQEHVKEGGNWRALINAFRSHVPHLWRQSTVHDKKRFLRHVLPYWNIHRHRVHTEITDLLDRLSEKGQLKILCGRILRAEKGSATIKLRHSQEIKTVPANWLINCMGPSHQITAQPLMNNLIKRGIAAIDELSMLNVVPTGALKNAAGEISSQVYTLGPPTKGACWEASAVPEIRRQCLDLVKEITK